MEAAAASSSLSLLSLASVKTRSKVAQNCHVTQQRQRCNHVCVKNARRTRVTAVPVNVDDVTTVLDPAPVEVTWQIVVGAIGTLSHTAQPLIFYFTCDACFYRTKKTLDAVY